MAWWLSAREVPTSRDRDQKMLVFPSLTRFLYNFPLIPADNYEDQLLRVCYDPGCGAVTRFSVLDDEQCLYGDDEKVAVKFTIRGDLLALYRLRLSSRTEHLSSEVISEVRLLLGDRVIWKRDVGPQISPEIVIGHPDVWLPKVAYQQYAVVVLTQDSSRNRYWDRKIQLVYETLRLSFDHEQLIREANYSVPEYRMIVVDQMDRYGDGAYAEPSPPRRRHHRSRSMGARVDRQK